MVTYLFGELLGHIGVLIHDNCGNDKMHLQSGMDDKSTSLNMYILCATIAREATNSRGNDTLEFSHHLEVHPLWQPEFENIPTPFF
jgi:hypothetical protein